MLPKLNQPYYWKEVIGDLQIGALTLFKDSDYQIGNTTVDQMSEIRDLRVANARIDKAAGLGEELRVTVTGQGTLRARYDQGSWWILVCDK